MIFVYIGIVILVILLAVLLVYLGTYRKQIKRICEQMDFLYKNQSELSVTSDIRDRNLLELTDKINRIHKKEKETELDILKKNDILRETIADLSHDIRTPLTSLDGYFQLMSTPGTSEDKLEYYRNIVKKRIDSIREMLEELFIYAKLQDAGYRLELTPIDFVAAVEETLMAFYEDIASAGSEPVIKLPEEPVMILGNREALSRIMQNLFKNVMAHGKNPELVMTKEQGVIRVEINDEPYDDINKIDVKRVFERFYKSDSSRRGEGSGLGMAIAKELVLRMRGTIAAECSDGRFRVFVSFPEISLPQ